MGIHHAYRLLPRNLSIHRPSLPLPLLHASPDAGPSARPPPRIPSSSQRRIRHSLATTYRLLLPLWCSASRDRLLKPLALLPQYLSAICTILQTRAFSASLKDSPALNTNAALTNCNAIKQTRTRLAHNAHIFSPPGCHHASTPTLPHLATLRAPLPEPAQQRMGGTSLARRSPHAACVALPSRRCAARQRRAQISANKASQHHGGLVAGAKQRFSAVAVSHMRASAFCTPSRHSRLHCAASLHHFTTTTPCLAQATHTTTAADMRMGAARLGLALSPYPLTTCLPHCKTAVLRLCSGLLLPGG